MKIAIKNNSLVFSLKIINIIRIINVYDFTVHSHLNKLRKKNYFCQIIYYNQYINDIFKNTHKI